MTKNDYIKFKCKKSVWEELLIIWTTIFWLKANVIEILKVDKLNVKNTGFPVVLPILYRIKPVENF